MSISITLDLSDISSMVDGWRGDVSAALRPAAQEAADVIYRQVKRNVAGIGRKTGNLASSIYQVYAKRKSNTYVATYDISWNFTKAPHGHLLEYGHLQTHVAVIDKRTGQWITLRNRPLPAPRQVGARPFLRPAQSKFPEAMDAAREELFRRMANSFL